MYCADGNIRREIIHTPEIANEMAYSSARRGTGIAHRTPEYVMKKMDEGIAAIAVNADNGAWAGFCYLEVWQHQNIVAPIRD
ncbi:MAG: hypothetical protein M9904_11880 [Chitinophagaceae bacterium]|nr:hypothetical protein [Chitinophagaceae bacterium]